MNSDIELRNHLLVEFLRCNISPLSINEERHHIDKIDEIVQYFINVFDKQVYETVEGKTVSTKTYNGQIPFKTYFKNYRIDLTIEYREGCKLSYDSGFNSIDSIKEGENGWYCEFNCRAKIITPSWIETNRALHFVLAHELTHGWNVLQYAIEHNEHPYYGNICRDQNYTSIQIGLRLGKKQEKIMSSVLYRLNRMERNAIIAQVRNELKQKDLHGLSFDELYKLVYETNAYTADFKGIEDRINLINSTKDIETQKKYIRSFNSIMHKNLTTFNQLKRHLNGRWFKWKEAFFTKVSKIAYDVYYENGNGGWLDWGMMGRD